jgi:hypothetical protein
VCSTCENHTLSLPNCVVLDLSPGYPPLVSDKPTGAHEVDELVRQAARDVDRTLIQWALSLSPLDRLRASVRSAASLQALRDAGSKHR